MGHSIRTVSVAERRTRLAFRHHLVPDQRAGTAAAAVDGIIGLHGTDPASVYLSVWARTDAVDKTAIEYALYEERSLVRMLGMRRTVFVVPTALVPVIQSACTDQIAERLRRQLTQVVAEAGIAPDAATWLKDVGEGTVRVLAARGSATGAELARDEPRLRTQIIAAADNPYGGAVNLTTRLLTLLSAEGLIVRGRPRGGWTSTQFTWSAAPERTDLPTAAARTELARQVVSSLDLTEVDLGGTPGVLLTGDEAPAAPAEPWAALLPALDPTAMGWRERSWYVGQHTAALFDRSGNIGPTIWWDGRIVGGWAQRQDGEIAVRLLEDVGTEAAAAIAAQARRLQEWIGPDAKITPRFRTPLERELCG